MRARLALSLSFAFATAILATGGDARADGDPEGAKKHFEAGKKLRAEGDCAKAIPEFEKSIDADRSIGALYNLGYCQEQLGSRQEAYDAYRRARDMASAKKDDRLKEISGALAALMETPNVRLVLPQPLPKGFELTVDGELVPPALYQNETVVFTKAAPTHDVRASAPGYDDTLLKVETRQLKVVDLKEIGKRVAAVPPPPPARPAQEVPVYRKAWFGAAVGLTGFVLAGTGTILAVKYQVDLDRYDEQLQDALENCGDGTRKLSIPECRNTPPSTKRDNFVSRATAYNNRDQAGRDALPLMIGLIAGGGILLIGGAYIFFTASSVEEAARAGGKSAGRWRLPSFAPILGPGIGGGSMSVTF